MNINQELNERLFHLMRLMHALHHSERQGSRGYAQDRALRTIAAQEGISQRDLMNQLDVRPSSMSELLTKLENGGLIERRPNPSDRRQVQLYLSGNGRAEATLLGEAPALPDPFAALTDDEKQQYLAMTDRMIEALTRACEEQGIPANRISGRDGFRPPFAHGRRGSRDDHDNDFHGRRGSRDDHDADFHGKRGSRDDHDADFHSKHGSRDDHDGDFHGKRGSRDDHDAGFHGRRGSYDDHDAGFHSKRGYRDDHDDGFHGKRGSRDDHDADFHGKRGSRDDHDDGFHGRRGSYDDHDDGFQGERGDFRQRPHGDRENHRENGRGRNRNSNSDSYEEEPTSYDLHSAIRGGRDHGKSRGHQDWDSRDEYSDSRSYRSDASSHRGKRPYDMPYDRQGRRKSGKGGNAKQSDAGRQERSDAKSGKQAKSGTCNGCGKGCKLTAPGCGRGAQMARKQGIAPKT